MHALCTRTPASSVLTDDRANRKAVAMGQQRIKVPGHPGLYQRGRDYEVRVDFTRPDGRRSSSWETVGTSIRKAIRRQIELAHEVRIQGHQPVPGEKRLTVAMFF